jgi:TPR repeat protein
MNEVIRIWRLAADQGPSGAQFSSGVIYHQDQRVAKSNAGAVRWYGWRLIKGTPVLK